MIIVELSTGFPLFFESSLIYEHFLPCLFESMHSGAIPLQHAASKAVCCLIRSQNQAFRRIELTQQVVREFGHSKNCRERHLFLDIAQYFLNYFSTRWFATNMLAACLQLVEDEIAIVRKEAFSLLPLFKSMLDLPADQARLDFIEHVATKAENDSDLDIRNLVLKINKSLSETRVKSDIIDQDTPDRKQDLIKEMHEDEMLWQEQSSEICDNKTNSTTKLNHKFRRRINSNSNNNINIINSCNNNNNINNTDNINHCKKQINFTNHPTL